MRPLAHVGPPLATTLAMTVNVVLLAMLLLRRGYLAPDRLMMSRLARMAAATGVMAAVLWRARVWLAPQPGIHVSIYVLAIMVLTGMAVYAAVALALGLVDLRTAWLAVLRRLGRRPRVGAS